MIRDHSGGDGGSGFRSLLVHPEKNNVPVLSAKGIAARKSKSRNAQSSATGVSVDREALAADEVITDQLVAYL